MTTATKPKSGQPQGKLYVWSRGGSSRVYAGTRVSMGQVIELAGVQNDAKLIDLGYLKPVKRGTKVEQCMRCGAWFLDAMHLDDHCEECEDAEVSLPGLEVDETQASSEVDE
jgi:hypothetical protein